MHSLEVGEPYERYIHQEELYGYSYPLKPNTVSSSAVFAMVTVVPSGIILFLWSFHRDKREMARASPPRPRRPSRLIWPGRLTARADGRRRRLPLLQFLPES